MPPFDLQAAPVLIALAHVIVGILVLMIGKLLSSWLSPYRIDQELTSVDNPAFGLAIAGYYAGVVVVFLGTARRGEIPLEAGSAAALAALGADAAWAVAGLFGLMFSRFVMDRWLIARCCHSDQIVRNRNVAAGAVECCVYISAAIVLAGVLRQPGGTALTALLFFLLSQTVLLLLGRGYQRLAGYAVSAEIESGNLAAGVAFGFTLIALALLMLKATSGEFVDWPTNLAYFAFDSVAGFVLLLVLRWAVDAALIPGARIAEEIARDRNVNVGLLEGVLAVGVAAIILYVF